MTLLIDLLVSTAFAVIGATLVMDYLFPIKREKHDA